MLIRRVAPILLSLTAFASGPVRDVVYQGDLRPLNIVPTFDNGYLAAYDRGGIAVYAPGGAPALHLPNPGNGIVWKVAVDTDGTVAMAESWHGHTEGGIAVFGPTGVKKLLIQTPHFLPIQVCFAPDHSLWALGGRYEMTDKGDTANDFLLRHYSPEGQEIGAFLRRTSFAEVREPWLGIIGGWNMHIAGNRVGMAVGLGEGRKGSRWVEVDLEGKELGRWPIDIDAEVAAFTPRGTVYADAYGGVIMVLDHATGKWAVDSSVGGGRLLGADGDSLVFNRDNMLSWAPITR